MIVGFHHLAVYAVPPSGGWPWWRTHLKSAWCLISCTGVKLLALFTSPSNVAVDGSLVYMVPETQQFTNNHT